MTSQKYRKRTYFAAIALTGLMAVPFSQAGLNPAFRKAKGTYDVTLSASGSAPGFGSRRAGGYPGVLRLPAKKGNVVLRARVEGRSVSLPGKITDARVRRGGKVVTYTGVTRVPNSAINQLPADIRSQIPANLSSQDVDELLQQIPADYRKLIPKSLIRQVRQEGIEAVAGSLTAPFRAKVNLQSPKPRVVATAELSVAGARGKVKATGVQR